MDPPDFLSTVASKHTIFTFPLFYFFLRLFRAATGTRPSGPRSHHLRIGRKNASRHGALGKRLFARNAARAVRRAPSLFCIYYEMPLAGNAMHRHAPFSGYLYVSRRSRVLRLTFHEKFFESPRRLMK